MKIHIVQKGDTLWKIAKKYGVNFEELKKMNAQLSNPDMIMPGMKIKVPDSGGTVKKEAIAPKKEMPIIEHPFVEQQPIAAPIKEAPPKEKVKGVQYVPKMPQPVVPEIDINNYYMMNMANMSIQKKEMPKIPLPPKLPKKEAPVAPIKEKPVAPIKEKPVAPIKEEPLPPEVPEAPIEQPVYEEYCVPVSPILPGPGYCPPPPCPPPPCPPGFGLGGQFAPHYGPGYPYPMPGVQGLEQPMPDYMEESSPFPMQYGQMPYNNDQVMGVADEMDDTQMPYWQPMTQQPFAQQPTPAAPVMQPYGQMPYGQQPIYPPYVSPAMQPPMPPFGGPFGPEPCYPASPVMSGTGFGDMGYGPMGAGPMGPGPMGPGPMGFGPMGPGQMGTGPMGIGPMGAGPMGAGYQMNNPQVQGMYDDESPEGYGSMPYGPMPQVQGAFDDCGCGGPQMMPNGYPAPYYPQPGVSPFGGPQAQYGPQSYGSGSMSKNNGQR